MRVGIITFHRASNYGAVLQAFALRKTISCLGFDCEIIDYGTVGEKKKLGLAFNGIKPFIASLIIFGLNIINGDIRNVKFAQFRKRHMKISERRYKDKKNLKGIISKYDFFCTGSDQVWNPFLTNGDLSYLLDFVHNPKRKFAYAASFGISKIPSNFEKNFSKLIMELGHVSVREAIGVNLVNNLCGRNVELNVDPTFLVTKEEWISISKDVSIEEPYILCFIIMEDPQGIENFCMHLRSITKYKIIRLVNPVLNIYQFTNSIKTAGPLEFLGLVRNASLVVTNSFHGTAFSIIFGIPFYTFLYNNERDIRLRELTEVLGLTNRLVMNPSKLPYLSDLPIDFERVHKILETKKLESYAFIKKALEIK